jgi:hypothetical protein
MAKEVHQFKLPFGAAQDSENARHTAIGKVILKLAGSNDRLPLIELREFLAWVNNVGGASGEPLVKSYKQLGATPWGLCCSAATAYRVVTIALHKQLVTREEQLGANYEQRPNSYRMNWPGVYAFINDLPSKAVRHADEPPSHRDEGPSHRDEGPSHRDEGPSHRDERFKEQLPSLSPLSPLFFDDDVGDGDDRGGRFLGDGGDTQTTSHDSDPPDRPGSAPLASHGPASPHASVAVAESRRTTSATQPQLVKLVRQCGVRAALPAVQAAIRHGHDVLAWVAAWKFFAPGWIPKYAPVHLYNMLMDEPCGLDPMDRKSWPPLDFPDRVPTEEDLAEEQRKAAETAEYLRCKAERKRRGEMLSQAQSRFEQLADLHREGLLAEYFAQAAAEEAASVRAQKPHHQHGRFLDWFIKRNGGANGNAN